MNKKISQLNVRPLLSDTDVFPVVAAGATETNKATLSNLKNNYIFPVLSGNAGRFLKTDGTSVFWDFDNRTLDQILTNGNVSDKGFILNGGVNGDLVVDGDDPFIGGKPTFLIRDLSTGQNHRLVLDRSIFNNNGRQLELVAPSLTGNFVLTYPNSNGVFVTKVNGVFADTTGNVTLSGFLPPQSGNAGKFLTTDGTSPSWQTINPAGDLQQVTDNGSVTTNPIRVLDNPIAPVVEAEMNQQFFSLKDTSSGFASALEIDKLIFFKNNSLLSTTLTPTPGATSVNVLNLPDGSGTLVASVNGVTADNFGNVLLPGTNQTLQEVTTAGNVTTDDIVVEEVTTIAGTIIGEKRSTIAPEGIVVNESVVGITLGESKVLPTEISTIDVGNNKTTLKSTNIEFQKGAVLQTLKQNQAAATNNNLELPAASGILVAKVNGISPDNSGNVTIPGATIPDLQQVTSVNKETNTGIDIVGGSGNEGLRIFSGGNVSVQLEDISPTIGLPNGKMTIRSLNTYFEFESALFRWFHIGGQTNVGYFAGTGTNDIVFPNNSGTLLVAVNGIDGGLSGSIQVGLDSVLENGSMSDNSFSIVNDFNAITKAIEFDAPTSIIRSVDSATGEKIEVNPANIAFRNGSGGIQTLSKNPNLTLTQNDLFLPIVDNKTLVTSVNGVFANDQGDVSIPSGGTTLDGLTDVTIASPANGQGLIFNSTSGQWQNATLPTATIPTLQQVTTAGNTTTNDIVLTDAAITGIDYLDFNLTPGTATNQEGRVQWNDELKTLQIDTENAGVQINVGHETIQRVRNETGATIQKGKICYINGASGNRPTITLSDNSSDPTSAQTIGFVISDIANGANGYLITNGLLEGVSTIGFAAGTQLFLSSNGNFQSTSPVQPLHNVRVGIVIDGNSPTGSIFVNILNGFELEELHDCLITSPANDQVLTYETASGLWKNKAIPAAGLPSQTGQSGKFLQTNGTSVSWQSVPTGAGNLDGLTDVTIATPAAGQALVFDSVSSQWQNSKIWLPWTIDFGFTSFNLAANETYFTGLYYGSQPSTLINNRPSRKAIIQKTGVLRNVQILTAMSAAAGAGNVIISFLNETQGTSVTITNTYSMSSGALSSLSRLDVFPNPITSPTGLNFAVNAGDVVQVRIQTPAWSTLPTGVSMQFVTLFES